MVGENVMTFFELQISFYEAAKLVNQRAIGRHPSHPDEGSTHVPQGGYQIQFCFYMNYSFSFEIFIGYSENCIVILQVIEKKPTESNTATTFHCLDVKQ